MTAPTRKTSPSLFPLSPPATRSRRYLFHPLLRLRRRNIPRLRWCGRPRLERRLASACEAGRGGPAGGVLVTFRACWSQLGDTEIGSSCRLESTFQPVVPSGQTRLRGPVLPPLLARSTRSSRCVLPCPPPRTGSGPAQLVRATKLSCANGSSESTSGRVRAFVRVQCHGRLGVRPNRHRIQGEQAGSPSLVGTCRLAAARGLHPQGRPRPSPAELDGDLRQAPGQMRLRAVSSDVVLLTGWMEPTPLGRRTQQSALGRGGG